MVPFTFAGEAFSALAGGLFWPRRKALVLADLHLEKASYFARFGQLLPPHDSIETLRQVAALVEDSGALEIWCLGDSFHDRDGFRRLSADARTRLEALTTRVRWTWITGNHDPMDTTPIGGRIVEEAHVDGICLRHAADLADARPEISGHWHPKLHLTLRGHRLSRPCFVRAGQRLVLPAFGAFTGGMRADDPALLGALGSPAEALVVSGNALLRFPLKPA